MMQVTLIPCERVLLDQFTGQPSYINVLSRVVVQSAPGELDCLLAYQITSDSRLPDKLRIRLNIKRPDIEDKAKELHEIEGRSRSVIGWIEINKLRIAPPLCVFELFVDAGKGRTASEPNAVYQMAVESSSMSAKRAPSHKGAKHREAS